MKQEELNRIITEKADQQVLQQGRNYIFKYVDKEGREMVIKSFKKPNIINQYVYGNLRKSKAKRSFEHAKKLLSLGIGTPEPLAYFENYKNGAFQDSYYISVYVPSELTFRELVEVPNYPDGESILRQFTAFSFLLHEKGVLFKDHSPGNTLIQKNGKNNYHFYLVDLNRMKFLPQLSFEQRMKNMSRLTPKKDMVEIMSEEYADLSGIPYEKVFTKMWSETKNFQKRYLRKKNFKQKIKRK